MRKPTPGVDLLLEVAQVVLGRGRVDVRLGEARRADREAGVVAADELDELARVLEAALGLRPLLLALRRVAAQGEHVVEAQRAHLVERGAQLVDGRARRR